MPTANEIQKERIRELEQQANELLKKCDVVTLASVNEQGYPRICAMGKQYAEDFHDIYFITSKRSALSGKATHFEHNDKASVCYTLGGDSVTLVGRVEFVTDRAQQDALWTESNRRFFPKGTEDPKLRIIRFHTLEATYWIGGKFRTCKYK